jgi:uncharacterized membrane protein YkvA (DUF1232 family)
MSPLKFVYSWYRNTLRHPKLRWWIVGGTLLYVLNPLDVLPDVFPVIGEIDDAVVVTILAAEMSQILLDGKKARKETKQSKRENLLA